MLNELETPDYLKGIGGHLAMMLPEFDRRDGKIHIITPAGIGDFCWVWSKLQRLAKARDVTFWFPDSGSINRVEPYCKLVGAKFGGYIPIDTKAILETAGEFTHREYVDGGVFLVHANWHLEAGLPLHSNCPKTGEGKEWHIQYGFTNPAPYVSRYYTEPYCLVHMANESYCEGNYFPRIWANALRWIEENFYPVKLIGAKWDEAFIAKVAEHYTPRLEPCIGQPLGEALSVVRNATAMVGVDSGLTIMATYYGLPALRAYPRWLRLMPGTWEDNSSLHPDNKAIFMDELLDVTTKNSLWKWLGKGA